MADKPLTFNEPTLTPSLKQLQFSALLDAFFNAHLFGGHLFS